MEVSIRRNGKTQTAEVDTDFLGDLVRGRLLRHAVRMYETNKRQGTHSVKGRSDLPFRKSALFKQKGTGRARVRHPQATQCRSGGVPHGPKVRDYSYSMPKRARREAMRSALLSKFRDGEISLIDSLAFGAPKTKEVISLLDDFGATGKKCLIVYNERSDNFLLSTRNLRRVEVMPVEELNAYALLRHKKVIMTEGALEIIRENSNES
ncbi:MAG: 50S ribosomal protein L4 [Planctomycetota bacterium]